MDELTKKRLKKIVKDSPTIVVLTGAGVSTKSNIPDFRGAEGIASTRYNYGLSYEEILSLSFFKKHPDIFYDFYWKHMVYQNAKPNLAHEVLAKAEKNHKIIVVTQNIDVLHQQAGSSNVVELHGNVNSYTCPACFRHFDIKDIETNAVSKCPNCGAILKPDVILYEEPLDSDCLERAVLAMERSTLLIIAGTSMRVYPAAGLPYYFRGPYTILINNEPTPYDNNAEFVIHEDIGETLKEIFED